MATKQFAVFNTNTSLGFGIFDAETADDAIAAMLRDADCDEEAAECWDAVEIEAGPVSERVPEAQAAGRAKRA